MKFKYGIKYIAALALSFLFCTAISGCSLFGVNGGEPKTSLSKPAVYRVGSIFSWEEVKGANKYIVSFGGGETAVTDTACRVKDIEKGGVLSIKAVNITADGKIKEQSETVEITLGEISVTSTKYKSYSLSDSDIIIPAQVEMAVIEGDGNTYGARIYIESRSTPLIVELYDVHCYYFGLEDNDNTGAEGCVTVRSLGQDGSSFRGTSGSAGATGATGGGLAWSGGKGGNGTNGGVGGRFNYVVFEGDKPITFRGGSGGSGGTGGVASSMNTKGGDGGNGGNGGTGLSATNAYVALEGAELVCTGGSGGSGGEGGYGKFLFSDDSGSKGANGSAGADFTGSRTEAVAYPIIEKTEQAEGNGGENNPSDGNGSGENESSDGLTGTFKFFSASQDGETYYVGDEIDGTVFEENFFVFIFKKDNTCDCALTSPDLEITTFTLTWEQYGNTVFLTDENGNITKATLNGDTLVINMNGFTITLKRG